MNYLIITIWKIFVSKTIYSNLINSIIILTGTLSKRSKVMVGLQSVEQRGKNVGEKKGNLHTYIHPHKLNEKAALIGLWTRPLVIFGKTFTCLPKLRIG